MVARSRLRVIPLFLAVLAVFGGAGDALAQNQYVVNRSDDANCASRSGTLRWAINSANADGAPSDVVFDAAIAGMTIPLECPLEVGESLHLIGRPDVLVDGSALTGFIILTFGGGLFGQSHSIEQLHLAGGADTQGIAVTMKHRVVCDGCDVSGNDQSGAVAGAGFHVEDGDLLLHRSRVHDNRTLGSGGAIFVAIGHLRIRQTTIEDNAAGLGGGVAFLSADHTIEVDSSTFADNQADQGGAIAVYAGAPGNVLTAVNSTFSGNGRAAGSGGAIYGAQTAGPPVRIQLRSCTFARNVGTNGSALALVPGPETVLRAFNTVLDRPAGTFNLCSGGDFGGTHNIWDDLSCAFGTVMTGSKPNTNPMVLPLANNGGPTQTHALSPLSPAIGAGNPGQCPVTDQRGVVRSGPCWMGAYQN